jgi:hypothetical protein
MTSSNIARMHARRLLARSVRFEGENELEIFRKSLEKEVYSHIYICTLSRASVGCAHPVRTPGAYAGGESKSASPKFLKVEWREVRQNLNAFCVCVCVCVDD